ncbi:hypothetical protein [Novosphingobium resinovorum]|uniref:hypothetical protein n=1 Tax=Novosphingobium resinovorum TaxID=158500 RepID=UPI002ED26468|nr:hypothetical protein [Novosphingobium resinovorum]
MMRYSEKPFLQYLDYFVLRAIGELTPQQERSIAQMAPTLSQAYDDRPWFEIVAAQMNFGEDYPAQIALVWQTSRESAIAQGIDIDPTDFTRLFVDANFPS